LFGNLYFIVHTFKKELVLCIVSKFKWQCITCPDSVWP